MFCHSHTGKEGQHWLCVAAPWSQTLVFQIGRVCRLANNAIFKRHVRLWPGMDICQFIMQLVPTVLQRGNNLLCLPHPCFPKEKMFVQHNISALYESDSTSVFNRWVTQRPYRSSRPTGGLQGTRAATYDALHATRGRSLVATNAPVIVGKPFVNPHNPLSHILAPNCGHKWKSHLHQIFRTVKYLECSEHSVLSPSEAELLNESSRDANVSHPWPPAT